MSDIITTEEEAKAKAILESGVVPPIDDQPEETDEASEETDESEDTEEDAEQAEESEESKDDSTKEKTKDAESDDDQPLYEVTVDGKKTKVPLKELVEGYQRHTDYTQKTQKLAEERKQFEAENATLKRLADVIEKDPTTLEFLKRRLFELKFGRPYTPQAEEQARQSNEVHQLRSEVMLSKFAAQHPELTDEQLLQLVQVAGQTAKGNPEGVPVALEIAYKALEAQTKEERLRALEDEIKQLKEAKKEKFVESRAKTATTIVQGKGGAVPQQRTKTVTLDGEGGTVSARQAALELLTRMQED